MEEDRYHLMGLKDGAWYIIYTATSRVRVETEYDYWYESCKQQTPEYILTMVVKVI